jgi:two-component system response regulator FixJ
MQEVQQQCICVIDDDRGVRLTLEALLSAKGYQVQQFVSAVHFLATYDGTKEICVLADVRMPGMDGLELQEEIVRRGIPASTIIITGHADVTLAVRAMKAGAFDLLEKPFDMEKLVGLLPRAFAAAREKLHSLETADRAQTLLAKLSPRERQVAELLCEGLSNKAIAARLSLSARTVELHRAHVMEKLGVSAAAGVIQILLDARASPGRHSAP